MDVNYDPAFILWTFLFTDMLIMTIIVVTLAAVPGYPAAKALNGNWRSWVMAPATNATSLTAFGRARWPYMLLGFSTTIVMAMPSLVFEAAGDEHMRKLWWDLPIVWVPWLAGMMAMFWWPRFATPRWNRDWERRRKEDPEAIPFTDEEIKRILAMPEDSKRRQRRLRNIRACSVYATGHENAFLR